MSARIFVFGDNIDTDQLAPGQYMKGGIAELAAHCLESVCADFSSSVKAGDIIVAGRNFGAGSSREQAAEALVYLGVGAVVAQSFAGIFFRNAINLGLPVYTVADTTRLAAGQAASLDEENDLLLLANDTITLDPLPSNLRSILGDGGLIAHLKKRFANS